MSSLTAPKKPRIRDRLKELWSSSAANRPTTASQSNAANPSNVASQPNVASQSSTASQSNTASRSNVKEGFEVAGRVAKTLLKKLPECIDTNPVKMAFFIVKAVIDMFNGVQETKGALAESLQKTISMLDDLTGMMEASDPDDIKQQMGDFWTKIDDERKKLKAATEKFTNLVMLDYESYAKTVEGICKCIHEATEKFKLKLLVNIDKRTARMHNDIKKASLKDLNPSIMANHTSILEGREACTVGTRVSILKEITDWANDSLADSPRVFWLTGQGGSGKTTIAYTIAQQFETGQSTVLGASFLCSRQFPETRSLKCVIPTIAYQFAYICEPFAAALHEQVPDKSATTNHGVSGQIDELLVRPWVKAIEALKNRQKPYLFVIDALDEIEQINGTDGSTLLRFLLTTIKANVKDFVGLKFLVTSRPDSTIVKLIDDFPSKAVCQLQKMSTEDAGSDIKTYLKASLPQIIDLPELVTLEERAGGLFIYVATIVKLLKGLSTEKQIKILRVFLSESSDLSSITDDKSPIDVLYRHVLLGAFGKVLKPFLQEKLDILFCFLCSAERISPLITAGLTGTTEGDAREVLEDLHAVLYIQDDRVFWYHASFPDFMFSQTRSNFSFDDRVFKFFCDEVPQHHRLASACFHVMGSKSGLRFNIGEIMSSFDLDLDHHGELSERVKHNIGPALRYSCAHWSHHLLPPPTGTAVALKVVNEVDRLISEFLKIRVLFWIEAMNLLGTSNQCTPMLFRARRWILGQQENKNSNLARDLLEAANFATRFTGSPAAESTPHLYISTLATWQQESSLSMNWRNHFPGIPVLTWQNKLSSDALLMTVPLRSWVNSVAFSPDGTKIVAGLYDDSIVVLDASQGTQLNELEGHTDRVNSVAFSHDGARIVTGSGDHSVRVWDASQGTQLNELNGHTDWVRSVAFSHDGALIVSGSYDSTVRVWDASQGTQLNELNGHTDWVSSVAFSYDGARIVSGSHDGSVWVWDASQGIQLHELNGHTNSVNSVAFSPDGARIVSGSYDNSVRVWDTLQGTQLYELNGHTDRANSVAFSHDGARIVSGSGDTSVRVWDVLQGTQLYEFEAHTHWVNSVAFSHDGARIVSGSYDNTVRVWDTSQGTQLNEFDGHSGSVNSVAFSPDGMRIVSGSYDSTVRVWDVLEGTQLHELKGHSNLINSVVFSHDGARIVSGLYGNSVCVWETLKGTQWYDLNGYSGLVNSVAFSHDCARIVLGLDGSSVRVWDISEGTQLNEFNGHSGSVNSVAFSPDGARIVSGSADNSVRVWDISEGAQLHELKGHSDFVNSVVFSHDGMQIVSGSDDYSVRVWDTSEGTQLNEFNGHTGSVNSVVFSHGGTRIVSGSADYSVRVWDTSQGTQLCVFKGHTGWVGSVAFSHDGTRIVSGSGDKSVRVWALNSEPATWYLTAENWALSLPGDNRLVWVPPEIILKQPYNLLVISRRPSAYVTFHQSRIGPNWQGCYTSVPFNIENRL